MARPLREGIDYFPLDVGFFRDRKIRQIKAEFGAKGIVIFLYILASAYEEHGYYFDVSEDDDFLLVAEGAGCGCSPEFTKEVVTGVVKRSLFDEGVFNRFGILTSQSMQRRFLRAVSTRDTIYVDERYWLLDINNKKDVPASISKKITFNKVSLQRNPDKTQRNPDKKQNNPKSRVEESKGKESKVEESSSAGDSSFDSDPDISNMFNTFEQCGFRLNGYAAERLIEMCEDYTAEWVTEAIKRSADRGIKNLSYIEGILRRWDDNGAIDGKKAEQNETDVGHIRRENEEIREWNGIEAL